MVELTVIGISLHEEADSPVLLLHPHGADVILPLHIGPVEAFAISTALHKISPLLPEEPPVTSAADAPVEPTQETQRPSAHLDPAVATPRPMSHDMMRQLLRALGGKLVGVNIIREENGVFYAEALLSTQTRQTKIDCRPSDGIALALRCNAPIKASEPVLQHAQDMNALFTTLPEHVRTLAKAALLAEEKILQAKAKPIIPLVVHGTLENNTGILPAPPTQKKPSITIKASPPNPAPSTTPITVHGNLADPLKIGPAKLTPSVNTPNIRVSFMRTGDGMQEFVEEFQLDNNGAAQPTGDDTALRLNENATDDDRWTALLRILSPETKVLM